MFASLMIVSLLNLSQPAPAKPTTPASETEKSREPIGIHMRPLQHATCGDIRETIRGLFGMGSAWCDERTNSLVCRVREDEWEKIQRLVDQLDQLGKDVSRDNLLMIPVRGRSAEEVARRISQVLEGRDKYRLSRVAADVQRSTILLSGTNDFLEQASKIIKQLDTPARTIQLEFAILHADMPPVDVKTRETLAESAVELPEDLTSLGTELKRFGKIRLLGRLGSVAVEGDTFEIAGNIAQTLECNIHGQISMIAEDGGQQATMDGQNNVHMRMELSMTMRGSPPAPVGQPGKMPQQRLFELKTSLSLTAGQTVVLGTAPTGWAPGESAILVVRAAK